MVRINKQVTFTSFCKIHQVEYWRKQLNEANIKNLNNNNSGTKRCYTYGLYQFNNWLTGKKFQYVNSYYQRRIKHKKTTIILKNVSHFLELYQNAHGQKLEFVNFIKQYLLWTREHKSNAMALNALYSIKSFFRENDSEIIFRFNKKRSDEKPNSILSIDDFKKILALENIQTIEKAVFLCKFQRGLDSSTFADRFNFEVWEQLVDYFGTVHYNKWDLNRCPVPIKLIRVKTNYLHVGFLDTDAIMCIQQYLEIRGKKIIKNSSKQTVLTSAVKPTKGEALFLDSFGNAISVNWIGRHFHKLYSNAIWDNVSNSKMKTRCTSHELRDLLKSTLIDAGCRLDIADHILGHAPKDSYEKQSLLYPSSIRNEFIKCSVRINCMSKTSHLIQHSSFNFNSSYNNSKNQKYSKRTYEQISVILNQVNICKANIAQIECMVAQFNNNFTD